MCGVLTVDNIRRSGWVLKSCWVRYSVGLNRFALSWSLVSDGWETNNGSHKLHVVNMACDTTISKTQLRLKYDEDHPEQRDRLHT